MNEIIINTDEIECIYEKDNLCFVKMKSGKVWLCPQQLVIRTGITAYEMQTKRYLLESKGLVSIPLSQKGKCERNG